MISALLSSPTEAYRALQLLAESAQWYRQHDVDQEDVDVDDDDDDKNDDDGQQCTGELVLRHPPLSLAASDFQAARKEEADNLTSSEADF